jgi:tRNA pseudouridine55 synthase
VLTTFLGERHQQPPRFSAVRTGGKRSYEHARAGIPVDPPRRTVYVHGLRLLALDAAWLRFEVRCSSGTYVRSLGRDIASALGTVGHLTALVRTAIGPLHLNQALAPDELESHAATLGIEALILPADVVLYDLYAVVLNAQETVLLRNGVLIQRELNLPDETPVRGYDADGAILGLLRFTEGGLAPRLLLK